MKLLQRGVLLLLVWSAVVVRGEEVEDRFYTPNERSKIELELGVEAGFPLGAGISIGFWGGESFPLVSRLSVGVGASLDLGIEMPLRREDTRLFIGASGGIFPLHEFFTGGRDLIGSVGPLVGINYLGFSISAGPALYLGGRDPIFAAQGKLGYSLFF